MATSTREPFTVTGPGLEKAYREAGPALSRALTAACAAAEDGTWYVRNTAGDVTGYAERAGAAVRCVRT